MRRKTKGVFSLPGGQKAQMKREGLKQRIIDKVSKIKTQPKKKIKTSNLYLIEKQRKKIMQDLLHHIG